MHQAAKRVAGIIGDHLTGPRTLPAKLIGPRYLRLLCRRLSQLFNDVLLRT
jgi:hypothetical protein